MTQPVTVPHGEIAPVAVERVTKTYGRVRAVVDLSFELAAGTIAGFLGPNGAGKTTTLRMVGGLVRPSGGRALIFGEDARRPSARCRLGYMPADPVFVPHLTGMTNLDLLAKLRHATQVTGRVEAAATVGLTDAELARPVGAYSSGMRQKLAIVAAVQARPDLIVLDEPANRLDPLAHRAFCALLRAAADGGATVLLSSHVLAEVEAVCDTVLLVREGTLVTQARVADLREHARRVVTLRFDSEPPHVPAEIQDPHVEGCLVTGHVPAERPDIVRRILSDLRIRDVTVAPVSLEDVVLDLYAGARR